jgi:hypothetical protein
MCGGTGQQCGHCGMGIRLGDTLGAIVRVDMVSLIVVVGVMVVVVVMVMVRW